MNVDENNECFLNKLESRIRDLVNDPKIDLIRNRNKEYKSISLKVYSSKSDENTMACKFRKRSDGKLKNISPKSMEDTIFTGKCVFTLIFSGLKIGKVSNPILDS